MPSRSLSTRLTVVRLWLGVLGLGGAGLTVRHLATMPPSPPHSDGFVHGMAALIGGVIIVLALGLTAIAVSLPTLLGRDDPFGFSRWQRITLLGASGLIFGGIVVALVIGVVTALQWGIILWLGFVAVAILVVLVTLRWRLAEALVQACLHAIP